MNDTAVPADGLETKTETAPDAPPSALRQTFGATLFGLKRWWLRDVVAEIEHGEVIEKRREDSALSQRYLFMIAMSGGIAILGLLLSSPAVVIGAMLLSPLMDPIMGLGFALAIGDYRWMKQSARTLAWGAVMAVMLCSVLVFFSPIQTITSEIAARTRPNLFDLFVALFSALAGAYAMIRGREGTIVGVAIATALMPPLATVGFGLATLNWTVFSGALLLFATNFLTIALTAWGMARLYGFSSDLSKGQTRAQNLAVAAVFIALAVPLGFSLQQIAWEANAQRIVRSEIREKFDNRSLIDTFEIDFSATPLAINATMLTPEFKDDAEADIARALTARLGREVDLTLNQYQVGTSASAAQQAQLSATRAREEADARARSDALALRLALVAGVAQGEVLIDRSRKRALVRAARLPGAGLATYRALETRIAATEPDWVIEVIPPESPLPATISFAEDAPDAAGMQALTLIGWAAQRTGRSVVLTGGPAQAEAAAEVLRKAGAAVTIETGPAPLRAGWAQEVQ
ncbi:MAG: TIGR00341 family protein [Erythrobacter sp.]